MKSVREVKFVNTQFQTGSGFSSTKEFLDTIWVFYDSTPFWHYLPAPSSIQTLLTSPGCRLGFWQTGYRQEFPMLPSLGSINLLEGLTELRSILVTRSAAY